MRTNGWVLIGRIGNEYYFVDSVFEHRDDFKGATGTILRPVSAEEWEWASDRENVAERLSDYWYCLAKDQASSDCPDCKGYPDPDEGCENCGVQSLDDLVDDAIRYDGIGHIMFDESNCCEGSDSFDELGIEHECTDCIGGGRIFGRDNYKEGAPFREFDEVYNRKALVAIQALEDKAVDYRYAARIVFGLSDDAYLCQLKAENDRLVARAEKLVAALDDDSDG